MYPHVDSFTVDTIDEKDSYTYVFQLCGDAGGVPEAGVLQVNKKNNEKTKIGSYTSTKAVGGSESL